MAMLTTPARASGDVLWATVPWMLLASPLAWADYLILVLPCVILMVRRSPASRLPVVVLFSVLVLIGRPFFVYNVFPVSVRTQLLGLALPTYGLLGLGLMEWVRDTGERFALSPRHDRLSATQRAAG
jgi:hypothetical protein